MGIAVVLSLSFVKGRDVGEGVMEEEGSTRTPSFVVSFSFSVCVLDDGSMVGVIVVLTDGSIPVDVLITLSLYEDMLLY